MDNIDDLYDGDTNMPVAAIPVARFTPAWQPRMVMEMALGLEDEDTILTRYDVSPVEWQQIRNNMLFKKELSEMSRQVQEKGLTFREKARVQAETYLMDIDQIITDPDTAPSLRLEAIKAVVRWGDLEPKKEVGEGSGGAQFNIQINL